MNSSCHYFLSNKPEILQGQICGFMNLALSFTQEKKGFYGTLNMESSNKLAKAMIHLTNNQIINKD